MKRDNDDSGFRWGPFNLRGPKPWRLQIEQVGGSVYYPYNTNQAKVSHHIRRINTELPIIHKGNHIGDFTHPQEYPDTSEWYYWDNSLLPEFMMPNPANPRGDKIWTRLVYRGIFPGRYIGTEQELEQRENTINTLIRRESGGLHVTWEDICHIRFQDWHPRRTRILLALCSAEMPWLYYSTQMNLIIETVRRVVDELGLHLDIRHKPARRHRLGDASIQHQLQHTEYLAVIGIHSAIGMEVVAQGIPYVSIGQDSLGGLAWNLTDLENLDIRPRTPSEVRQRQRELLLLTRSKRHELLSGSWSLDNFEKQFEPLTNWTITL